MGGQKINQSRRRLAFFPWHISGLVALFPIINGHVQIWIKDQRSIGNLDLLATGRR
jgi:hypothetical protein